MKQLIVLLIFQFACWRGFVNRVLLEKQKNFTLMSKTQSTTLRQQERSKKLSCTKLIDKHMITI